MNMALKPCPFCGGEASVKCEVFAGTTVRGYRVRCDNDSCNEGSNAAHMRSTPKSKP